MQSDTIHKVGPIENATLTEANIRSGPDSSVCSEENEHDLYQNQQRAREVEASWHGAEERSLTGALNGKGGRTCLCRAACVCAVASALAGAGHVCIRAFTRRRKGVSESGTKRSKKAQQGRDSNAGSAKR